MNVQYYKEGVVNMALSRPSDSLSKCDPGLYSNIYDVRKRPDLKNPVVTPAQPVHKDTIEISRDKLKEEALNRLRHTSKIVVATNSFMRVGKYLFMAIALPPYLLLYGMPKWVIVEALPALFSVMMSVWVNIQQKTKGNFEKGAHVGQRLFEYTQQTVKALILPIVRLAFDLYQSIRRFFVSGHQLFRKINEKMRVAISAPRKFVENGIKHLQSKYAQMKDKLSLQTERIAERFGEGIAWIKHAPVPFLAWGEGLLQRLKQQAISTGSPALQKWRTSRQLAQTGTEWVSEQCLRGMGSIQRTLAPIAAFYRGKMLPMYLKAKLSIQAKWRQGSEFFQERHRHAMDFFDQKQQRLKQLTYDHLIHAIMSQNWLPGTLKEWILKCLSHPFVKAICQMGIHLYAVLCGVCLKSLKFLLQGISIGVKWGAAASGKITQFSYACFQKITSFVDKTLYLCRKRLKLALYFTLLYTIMGVILLARSFLGLGTIMQVLLKQMVQVIKQTATPLNTNRLS